MCALFTHVLYVPSPSTKPELTSMMTSNHPSLDGLNLWPRDRLKVFLSARGLPVTGSIHELRALAYSAQVMGVPTVQTPQEEEKQRAKDYRSLLVLSSGAVLPDPLSDLSSGWANEDEGRCLWPPTMYSDMAEYLVERDEKPLERRLLGDYKDGKAFSYFDAGFIDDLLYHPVSSESKICFIKSRSARSQRRNEEPHRVWVALSKENGKIITAYCSCFAGLGATCNHIAGVLFKLDYAWQEGVTNKSCTSMPAKWTQPKGKGKDSGVKKISDMEWRKPKWGKEKKGPMNNSVRKHFNPLPKEQSPTLEELISGLYLSSSDACVVQYAMPCCTHSYQPEDDINVEREVILETSVSVPKPLTQLLEDSSCDIPVFSQAEVVALADATVKQHYNNVWQQQRIGRITSSTAKSVLVRSTKMAHGETDFSSHLTDTIMGRKSVPSDLPAVKYGIRMEPVARAAYIDYMKGKGHTDLTVSETGLLVIRDKIFIGASPDGIVCCSCCNPSKGLLEIKCPLSIAQSCPCKTPPDYLREVDGKLTLNTSHAYYNQVQHQMLVAKCEWCDFFVYTKHGQYCERIVANRKHQAQLLHAADVVFRSHILPDIQSMEQQPPTATASGNDHCELPSENTVCHPPPVKKRRTVRRKPKSKTSGPIYLCGVCQTVCEDNDPNADNSVGCDSCYQWFHWGCVGFEPNVCGNSNWYCVQCSNNL